MSAANVAVDGLDLPTLNQFFADHVDGFQGRLSAELLHGGRSNLTYRLSDGQSQWVLRRPPLGILTPSAHDMHREYRVVAALAESDVPVARAVAFGSADVLGVPFSVVEYVDGTTIRTEAQLDALSAHDIRRCGFALIDVMAALHAVDPRSVGLGEFGKSTGYLSRQVRRWGDQWRRIRTRELDDMDTLRTRLAAMCPADRDTSIVHGDFRIDNTILDPGDHAAVRAVVDWEMATLGDPLADLALHLVYGDPAFAPVLGGSAASTSPLLPAAAELAQRYATQSGRDVTGLAFYLALGYFKIAVIAEGIHARYLQGMTRGYGFDSVGQAVEPLASAGLIHLAAQW